MDLSHLTTESWTHDRRLKAITWLNGEIRADVPINQAHFGTC
jgi:hypothetical protein